MAIAIVFSKDRACQLHLLLESVLKNTNNELFSLIHVIYKTTTPEYLEAYLKAQKYFDYTGSQVLFHQEYDFQQDLLCILKQEQSYGQKYVCFFTDDDIIYQNIDLTQKTLDTIFSINEIGLISLRLGTNIVIQDIGSNMQTYIPSIEEVRFTDVKEYMIYWNWMTCPHHLDFGYPLSVDGHIFRLKDIIPITELVEAPNPNIYEGQMCHYLHMLPPIAIAYQHSKIVNTPINRVQDTFNNRHGDFFPINQKELNDLYLNGLTIDFNKIDFSNIICAHQELKMEFKQ